jgi:hypothetical protein
VLAAVGDISCQPGSPVEKEKQTDVCDSNLESSTAPAGTAPSYSDTGSQRCHGDGREY